MGHKAKILCMLFKVLVLGHQHASRRLGHAYAHNRKHAHTTDTTPGHGHKVQSNIEKKGVVT